LNHQQLVYSFEVSREPLRVLDLVRNLFFEKIPGYQESTACPEGAPKEDHRNCKEETFDLTFKDLAVSES